MIAGLRYFIPEWDDLVDPNYDFLTDTHSSGKGDWSNEVYAHQLYPSANYDGILVSKVVAEKSKVKAQRINNLGVHRYLRVPPSFPVMGDCGAFDYIEKASPPYTTPEILDYYTRLGFDYGVSIDHLIVTATEDQRQFRYDLTIHNAEEFLREHRARKLPWIPIGSVQGWSPSSYADAARQYVAMGYRYLALGGLVRSQTPELTRIIESVRAAAPEGVSVHLFGVARLDAVHYWASKGVTSMDCAGPLRKAWLSAAGNYMTLSGEGYSALRIPQAASNHRVKRRITNGSTTSDEAIRLEQTALRAVRGYDQGQETIEHTLDALNAIDRLIDPDRSDHTQLYRRTLEDMPWKRCPCSICRQIGVEAIIFRGNNRNRRRGFHNVWTFYRLLQEALAGKRPISTLSQLDLWQIKPVSSNANGGAS